MNTNRLPIHQNLVVVVLLSALSLVFTWTTLMQGEFASLTESMSQVSAVAPAAPAASNTQVDQLIAQEGTKLVFGFDGVSDTLHARYLLLSEQFGRGTIQPDYRGRPTFIIESTPNGLFVNRVLPSDWPQMNQSQQLTWLVEIYEFTFIPPA